MRCGLKIVSDDPDIRMLAAVSDGTNSMNLAAALLEQGEARHIFLPFTLSKDETMDFSHPTLDSVGRRIVITSVRMLVPKLVKADLIPKNWTTLKESPLAGKVVEGGRECEERGSVMSGLSGY